MPRVVIVGGGWAGCAAAVESRKLGAEVTLLERTDMLLGTGLVGGIMQNNGRFTAAEELRAMGGGELMAVIGQNLRHKNVRFPGHEHADLYNVAVISEAVSRYMESLGIEMLKRKRVTKAAMRHREGQTQEGSRRAGACAQTACPGKDRHGRTAIRSVEDADGGVYEGDVFIDATGTAGPMNHCAKYGNGCAMCILRCPSFGGRVSLTGLAGVEEIKGRRADGRIGSMSGSCKLLKESLSKEIAETLDRDGAAVIPIPEALQEDHLDLKCCQQYALPQFRDHIILLDTGHAKLMAPFYDLESLHQIPGLENARYEDPYAGGKGNSMRFLAMAPRDNALRVEGVENLFCAGEKAGLMVGHTEAIATGVLAGYNSVQWAAGRQELILPDTIAVGDFISHVKEEMDTKQERAGKYTFSGSVYFERMRERGLYSTDPKAIRERVEAAGLSGIFDPA